MKQNKRMSLLAYVTGMANQELLQPDPNLQEPPSELASRDKTVRPAPPPVQFQNFSSACRV